MWDVSGCKCQSMACEPRSVGLHDFETPQPEVTMVSLLEPWQHRAAQITWCASSSSDDGMFRMVVAQ